MRITDRDDQYGGVSADIKSPDHAGELETITVGACLSKLNPAIWKLRTPLSGEMGQMGAPFGRIHMAWVILTHERPQSLSPGK